MHHTQPTTDDRLLATDLGYTGQRNYTYIGQMDCHLNRLL